MKTDAAPHSDMRLHTAGRRYIGHGNSSDSLLRQGRACILSSEFPLCRSADVSSWQLLLLLQLMSWLQIQEKPFVLHLNLHSAHISPCKIWLRHCNYQGSPYMRHNGYNQLYDSSCLCTTICTVCRIGRSSCIFQYQWQGQRCFCVQRIPVLFLPGILYCNKIFLLSMP